MLKIVLVLSALAGVLADGATANTLTVTVTDDAGAPLTGQAVALAADSGVVFSTDSLNTDATGSATASLTSNQAGTYQVTATLADGTSQSISVVFLAVPVSITPVAEVKTGVRDFEKAFQFVADDVVKLGEGAKDGLVALA